MNQPENTPATEAAAPATPHKRRRWMLWTAAALVPVFGVSGAVAAQAHKTVEIDVDGEITEVSTWSGSVTSLLEKEGIELGPHDEITPALGSSLSSGDAVVVRYAQQHPVILEGEEEQVWTTASSITDLLNELSRAGHEPVVPVTLTEDGDLETEVDLPLVDGGGAVVIAADGERDRHELEDEAEVVDALEVAEIELGEHDELELTAEADAAAGAAILAITRVEHGQETETEEIEFEVVRQADSSLYEGTERVTVDGQVGERTRTFETVTVDGEEVERELVSEEVTTEPVDRVITYGTAERPAPEPEPAPAPAPAPQPASSPSSGSSSGGDSGGSAPAGVWAQLAQCESGGNPSTNTGNGYYGMYQFALPTWQSVGGTGLPSEASAAEQTQRAQILQQRAGWGQWPACARSLGLL
ncbi:resuscitation-promoting factor [Bogoriella caseilytica]|uniref:Uncharacterized protein YabE (DUF348 family) n=1 Tax=Bogoriella caseilytica TaxID=56055 RepID=A0A3N2BAG2_9MICO|nr:resuscitation-promoting factor [Bogoriella caseilytica]ROR72260.1 uncharacterized protein YabE (DUF348 family) [Bogoriella caseilytica]